MAKLHVKGGGLWFGAKRLGSATALFCYPGEERALGSPQDGIVVYNTPGRIDLLFTAGEKVVGCEVKRVDDLVSSHRSHRLHRQLNVLLSLVDIPCLVVRGLLTHELDLEVDRRHPHPAVFWGDWVNWQTRGVYVLPVDVSEYLPRLCVFRQALATTGARALAGSDQRSERERRPGWLLRRIPGIGPDRSARLVNLFGTTAAVFAAAQRGEVAPHLGKSVQEKINRALTA